MAQPLFSVECSEKRSKNRGGISTAGGFAFTVKTTTATNNCYNLGAIIAFGNITNYPVLGDPLSS